MLFKLAAKRTECGYGTKKAFVDALNQSGLPISNNTYNRIESGMQKADVETAMFIADYLNCQPQEIFLPIATRKQSRNDDRLVG